MANESFTSASDSIVDEVLPSIGEVGSRMKESASALGEKASELGHEAVDATADYMRDHGVRDLLSDVESYVKNHPTQALVGAVVLGFCAGRILSRD